MDGIVLQRAEFLVLLDALKTSSVIGLPRASLMPENEQQYRTQVQQGIESLKGRGLLHLNDGLHILKADLIAMATVLAYPQLAVITTRNTPAAGQQVFLHYLVNGLVVEQTFPAESEHRLATFSRAHLVERLQSIVAAPQPAEASPETVQALPQTAFIEAQTQVDAGRPAAAQKALEKAGLGKTEAQAVVANLQQSQLNCVVTLLKCKRNVVTDSRAVVFTQGEGGMWLITQTSAEADQVRLARGGAAAVTDRLRQWVQELVPLPA